MAAALIAAAGGGSGKPRLPTPDTGHLGAAEFDKVYEPVEDSFLLLDALELDQDDILALSPKICVEIGSGSGVAITCLASLVSSLVGADKAKFFATDINPNAVEATTQTAVSCKKQRRRHGDPDELRRSYRRRGCGED